MQQRTRLLVVAKREWELSFDSLDLPLAVVRGADHTVRRANIAYARVAGQAVQGVSQNPACHQLPLRSGHALPGLSAASAPSAPAARGTRRSSTRDEIYVLDVYPMAEEGQAVCAYRDVTDERMMTARLVETEKMAAVGQLAGGVAHEINNPLAGILTFAQLMKRDAGRASHDLESLQLIEESALRCKRIVESLLQFSRRSHESDKRPFDLNRCVEDAAFLFRAQLKKSPHATLEVKAEPDLPSVIGDTGQLGQVLLNLLQNGLYAPGGEAGDAGGQHRPPRHPGLSSPSKTPAAGIEPSVLPAHLRAVLHHQAARRGYRARPGDRLPHRPGPRRPLRGAEPPGEGSTFTVLLPIPPTSFPSTRN